MDGTRKYAWWSGLPQGGPDFFMRAEPVGHIGLSYANRSSSRASCATPCGHAVWPAECGDLCGAAAASDAGSLPETALSLARHIAWRSPLPRWFRSRNTGAGATVRATGPIPKSRISRRSCFENYDPASASRSEPSPYSSIPILGRDCNCRQQFFAIFLIGNLSQQDKV
jgi:hypothetical protein